MLVVLWNCSVHLLSMDVHSNYESCEGPDVLQARWISCAGSTRLGSLREQVFLIDRFYVVCGGLDPWMLDRSVLLAWELSTPSALKMRTARAYPTAALKKGWKIPDACREMGSG
jgi:hypothetical protein